MIIMTISLPEILNTLKINLQKILNSIYDMQRINIKFPRSLDKNFNL